MNATLEKPSAAAPSANVPAPTRYVSPRAQVFQNKEGFVLQAELPGVNKDGLEVTVENGELTIVGRRAKVENRGRQIYGESRTYDFRRTFDLDDAVDTARISAKLDQGVLTLQLPKAEAVKPRQIPVG